MSQHIKQSIEFAYNNNIAAMQSSIENAIKDKLVSALENKKIEVAQSFMQPTSERVSEELEEAYPRDRSDYDEGDAEDELSAFKGHMDDHPNYKKVAGYGKYKQFGVYKIRDSIAKNNPLAVPYIVSSSGKAVSHTNNRRIAHQDAKRLSLKEETNESAPSAGLSAKEKSAVVKKAISGKDIGKKGKGFEKIVANAKKYGAKDPEAVAAAAMWKNIKR